MVAFRTTSNTGGSGPWMAAESAHGDGGHGTLDYVIIRTFASLSVMIVSVNLPSHAI